MEPLARQLDFFERSGDIFKTWLHWNVWRHQMSFEISFMPSIGTLSFLFSYQPMGPMKLISNDIWWRHMFQRNQAISIYAWIFGFFVKERQNVQTIQGNVSWKRATTVVILSICQIFNDKARMMPKGRLRLRGLNKGIFPPLFSHTTAKNTKLKWASRTHEAHYVIMRSDSSISIVVMGERSALRA